MIKLDDDTIGLWFVTIPEKNGEIKTDWLAGLGKEADGQLVLQCRFRHYRDDKTFESKDKKNWYRVEISDEDVDHAIATVRELAAGLWKEFGGKRYEVLMGPAGLERLTHEWMQLPFNTKVQVKG